ncbi:histidine phosphatase family protein [Andreprevotia sp. IGB-42]|uniref:histidine phosphatase family protein n=1 Tax=Andreprevotia sp. IGB-42 TaxID=2497473 RepID=UPI00191FD398|nr:histidine phosphatase family protein [Andreprevotia sp. IGB-42]
MVVIVSTASRAASSAHALGRDDFLVDALFCEAQLPFPNWRFPYLPAQAWALLFRIGWLFGYARGTESVHECRQRARQAALRLAALAAQQPILLMGHGVMNELIAKELLTMGWQGPPKTTGRYWDFSQYQKCGDGPVYTSDM